MTHTIREKQKLLARVRRIRGQGEAIERALEAEAGCERVMHLLAGTRAAMGGLMAEVVEDHVRTHLVDPENRFHRRGCRRHGISVSRSKSLPSIPTAAGCAAHEEGTGLSVLRDSALA
ncbi:metal/formaldehyde-sensitive transcriptional repressor [Neoroseomonas soli]|uniref:Metal/formaldehyde-sensitive transcriptional repressor n=1 Tax=Neoroseomonas soli TaxID=1081025 RepID=A0A9X9WZ95_9PROT|nr:metal/formaldehyde-sensitive transcriptional repressor [Neoroseomonas soli]MBR0672474.1 metal/formaldehyde-sensitive transcriptional repressor [Neoroseomonas soli]